ncbi:MAG: TIGR02281 family clan AA aspartic protease [Xanthomonadales bacterium]|nr:TIGR02281 family clan AA aspartic protease [Xanthomonadales bacterium]
MESENRQGDRKSQAGQRLAWLAILGLMIGLTAFFQAMTGSDGGMSETIGADGRLQLVLQRERNGHYIANGAINGEQISFLVDTGATDVAVSERTARELGLPFGPRIGIMTAAGPAPAWGTRLDRVSLGGLFLEDVRATITPGLGREALLGMSFLKHFNIRQEGDRLLIEPGAGPWNGVEKTNE